MPYSPPWWYRKTRGIIRSDTRANQPVATDVLEGTLYHVTDEFIIERSNGATWESFVPSGGAPIWTNTPYNAGDYTADVNTWTVASGDVTASTWQKINPITLVWTIAIAASATVGVGNNSVLIKIPNSMTTSFAAGSFSVKPSYVYNAGAVIQDCVCQVADATHIAFHRGGVPFTVGQLGVYVTVQIGVD